jgi:hypothetical protein
MGFSKLIDKGPLARFQHANQDLQRQVRCNYSKPSASLDYNGMVQFGPSLQPANILSDPDIVRHNGILRRIFQEI